MKLILEEWKKFLKEVDIKPVPKLKPPTEPAGPRSLKIDLSDVRTAIDNLNRSINDMKKSDHDNHQLLQQLALFASDITDASEEGITGPNHQKIANDIKDIRAGFAHMPTLDLRGKTEISEASESSMEVSKVFANWSSKIVGNEHIVELGKSLAAAYMSDPDLPILVEVERIFEDHANRIVEELQQLAEDLDLEPTAHAAMIQSREL